MLKEIKSVFKFATAFGLGLISGVMVGVFLAPKSGKELRKDLREEARNKLEELEEAGLSKVRKVGHVIRDTADKMCLKIDKFGTKSESMAPAEKLMVG